MTWADAFALVGFFWGICFLVGFTQYLEHKEAMKQLDVAYMEALNDDKT